MENDFFLVNCHWGGGMLQLGFCAEVLETDSEKDILICKKNLTLLARASCGFFLCLLHQEK